jgi:hypothetical protein
MSEIESQSELPIVASQGTGSIPPTKDKFEPTEDSDRASRLDAILAKATKDVTYHSGETMIRGEFGDAPYSLLKAPDGYHIAMLCQETALHIHIALNGQILRSEESPNHLKPDPGTEDEVLVELTNGVNRFAKQYANVDGLIGVLEDDIS